MGCCLWGHTESDPTEETAPVGVFSRGTTRISGSLSCGAREVRSPCAWRGQSRWFYYKLLTLLSGAALGRLLVVTIMSMLMG